MNKHLRNNLFLNLKIMPITINAIATITIATITLKVFNYF